MNCVRVETGFKSQAQDVLEFKSQVGFWKIPLSPKLSQT